MSQVIQWTGFSGVGETARLMALGSDTVIESQAGTESTNDKGEKSATFATTNTGEHKLCIVRTSDGKGLQRLRVNLAGSGTAIAFDAGGKIDSALERDGSVYRLTANALELAPTGSGGDGSVIVQPYSTHAPQRVKGTSVTAFLGEGSDVSITLTAYDADGEPLPLTGLSLSLIIAAYDDPDTPLIAPQTFTGSGSTFSITLDAIVTAAEVLAGKAHHWSLRDGTKVIQRGRLEVVATAAQGA